jgi:hypothetical protein
MVSSNHGVIPQFISADELEKVINVLKTFNSTPAKYGAEMRGVDINHKGYLWFKKILFDKICNLINPDMKLIFGTYSNHVNPIGLHQDLKMIPNNAQGKNYRSFLLPYSVDFDRNLVNRASTIFYKGNNRDELFNPNEIFWNCGDLLWWDSEVYHESGDFLARGHQSKQAIVIHSYV